MKYELFNRVALTTDIPNHGLRAGDVAIIIEYHPGRQGQSPGYTLEVFNAVGYTWPCGLFCRFRPCNW